MASSLVKSLGSRILLSDGNHLPILGLGTWMAEKDACRNAALHALGLGYRLIDTASCYENEKELGSAIRESGIPREEMFITSKLWTTDHGTNKTKLAFKHSLEKLGLKYLDMYLIHSPTGGEVVNTWDALIELQAQGLIRSIGVSNFNVHHLTNLIKARPDNPPVVNQIELSPFLTREEIVSYCNSVNIAVQAYSPLTKGQCLNDKQLIEIAERYKKSVSQILIRWSIQRGYSCLPKSVNYTRIKDNCDIFDFEISHEDMMTMNAFNRGLVTDWDVIDSEWTG